MEYVSYVNVKQMRIFLLVHKLYQVYFSLSLLYLM